MRRILWNDSKFQGPELLQIVESVSGEKGLDKNVVLSAIEGAVVKAAKTKYGEEFDIRAKIDPKTGVMSIAKCHTIVENEKEDFNEHTEIRHFDALKNNPDAQIGDVVREALPPLEFGRWAAQAGRQAVGQIFKIAEKNKLYEEFKDRVGTIVGGIVKRSDFNGVTIEIGRIEVNIRRDYLILRETFRVGDRIRAYVVEVVQDELSSHILLSRIHPQFLVKLFESEVPEIYDGVIEVKSASRDPGSRAKIAVYSRDKGIDPIGACVGVRGTRVQAVVQELRGEKIDIVLWDSDIATFAVNALAPAEVSKVVLDEENKSFEVLVADDQLSLAIGRKGQNVRLASQLVGWRLEVICESEAKEKMNKEYHERSQLLMDAIGCDEMLAHLLVAEDFSSPEDLAYVDLEELSMIDGIDADLALEIQTKARKYIEETEKNLQEEIARYDFDPELLELDAFVPANLVKLGRNGILKLDDLADLANDELVEIVPELDSEMAGEIIMKAREKANWFND